MKRSDFWFDLPEKQIAQTPVEPRDHSRLLLMNRTSGACSHHHFYDIVDLLQPGDLLVVNDSRVIPARLYGVKEDTGAHIEVLLLEQKEKDVWETLVKPGKKAKPGVKLTFGDGLLHGEVLETVEGGNRLIRFSYEGAWEALSYRVIYGSGCSINIADIAPKGQGLSMQPDDINMNDVFKAVHIGVREDIEHAVFSLVKELKDNAKTIMQYNFTVLEIVGHLYRFCGNNHMKFEDHAGEIKNAYEEITKMDESALMAWLVRVALSISDELKNARNSSLRYLISEAKNIVRDEYADADLSLDTVCSKLGVSNSYFSSIFKKEVGISFITYLTDYRMQQAVHLMLETNEKNYEIAEHVGYEDANYFGYVFKRKYGMSPSKYRTEHMGK